MSGKKRIATKGNEENNACNFEIGCFKELKELELL